MLSIVASITLMVIYLVPLTIAYYHMFFKSSDKKPKSYEYFLIIANILLMILIVNRIPFF